MNVYDFDGTIYNGDSTVDFYCYVLKRKPYIALCFPKQVFGFVLYALKRIDKTRLKEYFFGFLPDVDAEELAVAFWRRNGRKIYPWYYNQQKPDDMIISASPEFLLRPICQSLGVKTLIATKVDTKTGELTSENCRGQEKVRRLQAETNVSHIDEFYSDSASDLPLAQIAQKAFLVKRGTIRNWHEPTHTK